MNIDESGMVYSVEGNITVGELKALAKIDLEKEFSSHIGIDGILGKASLSASIETPVDNEGDFYKFVFEAGVGAGVKANIGFNASEFWDKLKKLDIKGALKKGFQKGNIKAYFGLGMGASYELQSVSKDILKQTLNSAKRLLEVSKTILDKSIKLLNMAS